MILKYFTSINQKRLSRSHWCVLRTKTRATTSTRGTTWSWRGSPCILSLRPEFWKRHCGNWENVGGWKRTDMESKLRIGETWEHQKIWGTQNHALSKLWAHLRHTDTGNPGTQNEQRLWIHCPIALFLAYPQAELRALVDDQMREELPGDTWWMLSKEVWRNFRVTDIYDGQEWMEWNGMEWRLTGMLNWIEWNGMGWNGLDWNDMAWHETFQFQNFEGSLARKLLFNICSFQILREVSHNSFDFTSATFRFWGRSRTKASFSHLPLSLLEESLARKLLFHIFQFQILREVSHESFVFTSATFSFWGKSRTKASFSHLPLSVFEGSLAQKLHFHICHFQILREVSHEMRFGAAISDAVARSSIVLCNSASANRIVMAASRLLGAAAACVILLSFAAGHRESYWSGCIKAAILICSRFSQCWRCWFSFSRERLSEGFF